LQQEPRQFQFLSHLQLQRCARHRSSIVFYFSELHQSQRFSFSTTNNTSVGTQPLLWPPSNSSTTEHTSLPQLSDKQHHQPCHVATSSALQSCSSSMFFSAIYNVSSIRVAHDVRNIYNAFSVGKSVTFVTSARQLLQHQRRATSNSCSFIHHRKRWRLNLSDRGSTAGDICSSSVEQPCQ
jgi:hypothetical protein